MGYGQCTTIAVATLATLASAAAARLRAWPGQHSHFAELRTGEYLGVETVLDVQPSSVIPA